MSNAQQKIRSNLRKRADFLLEAVQEFVSNEMEKVVIAQLREWKARYPRHSFRAGVWNGSLMIEVNPKVNGQYDLTCIGDRFPLSLEADDFIDFFNDFDQVNIGVGHMDWVTDADDKVR